MLEAQAFLPALRSLNEELVHTKHDSLATERSVTYHKLVYIVSPMEQPVWNFEQEPGEERLDETGVNLRAYFDRMPNEKMQQYRSDWTDEQVIDWDDNFRDDGNLMLLCCERDVEVREYRKVLENCINYRNLVRATATTDR